MLKKLFKISLIPIGLLIVLLAYVYFFAYFPVTMGEAPKGELLERLKKSPQYDEKEGGFVNQDPDAIRKMYKRSSLLESFIKYYEPTYVGWPSIKIAETKLDKEKVFSSDRENEVRLVWTQ